MRRQADELLAARPEVIVALSNPAVSILKPVSGQVPIVFAMVADPVGSGFIENLARPGGKITGFTNFEPTMGGKWLEVVREASPTTGRVLVLIASRDDRTQGILASDRGVSRPAPGGSYCCRCSQCSRDRACIR